MARRRKFDTGFASGEASPEDISRIGTILAIERGRAEAMRQLATVPIEAYMGAAFGIADTAIEQAVASVESHLGYPHMLAQAATEQAQRAVMQALLPGLEIAASLGYQPAGAPGQGRGRKRGKRKPPAEDEYPAEPPLPGDDTPGDPAPSVMGDTAAPGSLGPSAPAGPHSPALAPGAGTTVVTTVWYQCSSGRLFETPDPTAAPALMAQGWVRVAAADVWAALSPDQQSAVLRSAAILSACQQSALALPGAAPPAQPAQPTQTTIPPVPIQIAPEAAPPLQAGRLPVGQFPMPGAPGAAPGAAMPMPVQGAPIGGVPALIPPVEMPVPVFPQFPIPAPAPGGAVPILTGRRPPSPPPAPPPWTYSLPPPPQSTLPGSPPPGTAGSSWIAQPPLLVTTDYPPAPTDGAAPAPVPPFAPPVVPAGGPPPSSGDGGPAALSPAPPPSPGPGGAGAGCPPPTIVVNVAPCQCCGAVQAPVTVAVPPAAPAPAEPPPFVEVTGPTIELTRGPGAKRVPCPPDALPVPGATDPTLRRAPSDDGGYIYYSYDALSGSCTVIETPPQYRTATGELPLVETAMAELRGPAHPLVETGACLPMNDETRRALTNPLEWLKGQDALDSGGCVPRIRKWADDWHKTDTWYGSILSAVGGSVACLPGVLFDMAQWAGQRISYLAGCKSGALEGLYVTRLLASVWERWLGALPEPVERSLTYTTQYLCPNELPTAAEATAAYLRDGLTDPEWECIVKANGAAPMWARKTRDAERESVSALEALSLERRGKISEDAYLHYLRRQGWTDPADAKDWRTAQEWVPSPSDAIEWMLKDVSDPQVYGTFGLEREFQQKYTGDTKSAFVANGISDNDALNLWKAHWRNMAPHQLYELHKRLRPGFEQRLSDTDALEFAHAIAPRRPVGPGADAEIKSLSDFLAEQQKLGQLYGAEKTWQALGYPPIPPLWREDITTPLLARAFLANQTTTGFHIYEALGQADYPPFWRERLLAISYNVLTRVDIRRAYETGQITLAQLTEALQDRGYTSVDAGHLAGFYREAARQLASRRPAANQWVTVGYDPNLLRRALIDVGMRADDWDDVFGRLQTRRRIEIQRLCISAIRKRYLAGLQEHEQAAAALVEAGLDTIDAEQRVRDWNCLKAARPKHESASEICLYLKAGMIGGKQARQLLRRLGYTGIQARRMTELCLLKPLPKGFKKLPSGEELQQLQDLLES